MTDEYNDILIMTFGFSDIDADWDIEAADFMLDGWFNFEAADTISGGVAVVVGGSNQPMWYQNVVRQR